ncbi:MAG: multicopper oxidase domain-containing protein [Nitrospirae bacterium]|nr:multicopper oxidase domain-containing protein [Nitrospirota bacterium]
MTSVFCLLSLQWEDVFASQEILKTSRVRIGEKVLLTDLIKGLHEEGKAIVLVLLSNPMQCTNCDSVVDLIEGEAKRYKDDVAFIVKGGQDMLGAMDEETVTLKRVYGFVTMGEPWTFVIDKEGVLKKIFIGRFTSKELEDIFPNSAPAEIKEFILTVREGEINLGGDKSMVWTYNGTVPGPEIRVREGDTVKIKLVNESGAKHGLFFHGLSVNPRVALQEQEIFVDPGYEYTYGEFIAKPAGTHLYHCSWNMAEHLSRGLYGAFIVEAKDEQKFDKEFVYILSDWSSKVSKGEEHYGAGHPRTIMDNDITTINERVITGDNPIIMDTKEGEKIRIRLANIGQLPHTLRFPGGFLITHEDGYIISVPQEQESLTIYPGKRYDIVITAAKPGRWPFYHSIVMPGGMEERLMEVESPEKAHEGYSHESPGVSPMVSNDEHEGHTKELVKEVPILVMNVMGGGAQ